MSDDVDTVLTAIGGRLRALRQKRNLTLTALAESTGISISTLSRLEAGLRKPSLELLLPLARAHGVALDELVGAPSTGDPRVHATPVERFGMTIIPLTRELVGLQAFKMVISAGRRTTPELKSHDGYEWLFVLGGKLRLRLAEHDLVLASGEAAEFDTRTPHWFGSADGKAVEIITLFGPQGERLHVRARTRSRAGRDSAGERPS
jgi:transcriptional regulator with XRE-family HTH domain